MISSNKLYIHNFAGFKLSEDRPEVKAWTDMISLKSVPVSKKELERLKQVESNDASQQKGQKKKVKKVLSPPPGELMKTAKDKSDPSSKGLLEKQLKALAKEDKLQAEFLKLTELQEFDQDLL